MITGGGLAAGLHLLAILDLILHFPSKEKERKLRLIDERLFQDCADMNVKDCSSKSD
jgi:hypothetical protein